MKIVATSGYFNPLHKGHVRLIQEAKKLGDYLIVIVNNDEQVKLKGSVPFMTAHERAEIVAALKAVDEVIIALDDDRTVRKTLQHIKPHVFAKGGDTMSPLDIPETEVCSVLNIEMVFGVGGGKIQSSSWLKDGIKK
ncbi:MAG: adenylyltransferase/cytidyltransferase family protein [Patescibacteria group bacterium]